jgi:hypothetical protein
MGQMLGKMLGQMLGQMLGKMLRLLIGLTALGLVGCASTSKPVKPIKPLAVPYPLEVVAPAQPTFYKGCDGRLAVDGPTVIGTRGQGLNVATSVHRIFLAMGIPTEVSVAELGPYQRRLQTQVQIAFPDGLSPHEQSQVKRVLVLLRPRMMR